MMIRLISLCAQARGKICGKISERMRNKDDKRSEQGMFFILISFFL